MQPAVDDRLRVFKLPEEWRQMVGQGNARLEQLVKDFDEEYNRLAGLMMNGEMVFFDKLNQIRKKIESAVEEVKLN